MAQNTDLTTGSIPKKLILFFLPIAAGTLFQQLYNTVDAMVVGKFLGTAALAAVGGSASLIIALFIGFFVALTGGASAIIAQLSGARQHESVSRAVHSSFAFCIAAGLLLMVLVIPITPWLLRLMQTPEDTMADSVTYLQIYFLGSVFMLIFNMGSAILQAVGDSRHPLYYLIFCCFCNIFLDLLLVVVIPMGIAGAALATVISQAISCLLILFRFFRSETDCRLSLKKLRIHRELMGKMLGIGIPSGLQAIMYTLSNMVIQVAINSLMTVAVAAWSISNKVDGMYSCVSTALGMAVMGFVGQNYGAGREDRVKKTLSVSLKIFLPVTLVLGALVLLFARYCLFIFIDDPEVISTTQEILWYLVPFYVVWTFIEILSGSLRGLGDAIMPLVIIALGICGMRLVWIGAVFPFLHSIGGLSLCYPVTWCITAAALSVHCRRKGWLRSHSRHS